MANLGSSFEMFGSALKIHEIRSKILAHNLANKDTPNFKAKDINFTKVLESIHEFEKINNSNKFNKKENFLGMNFESFIKERNDAKNSLDGNTVDSDYEKMQFSENSIRYLASLRFINNHIQNINLAIKG